MMAEMIVGRATAGPKTPGRGGYGGFQCRSGFSLEKYTYAKKQTDLLYTHHTHHHVGDNGQVIEPDASTRFRPSFIASCRARFDLCNGLAEHLRVAVFRGMEA